MYNRLEDRKTFYIANDIIGKMIDFETSYDEREVVKLENEKGNFIELSFPYNESSNILCYYDYMFSNEQ